MTNIEYAKALREVADLFETVPDGALHQPQLNIHSWSREQFLKFTHALSRGGKVTKSADPMTNTYPQFHAVRLFSGLPLEITISRETVCKLIRPAEYECPDSLLAEAAEYPEPTETPVIPVPVAAGIDDDDTPF